MGHGPDSAKEDAGCQAEARKTAVKQHGCSFFRFAASGIPPFVKLVEEWGVGGIPGNGTSRPAIVDE